MNSLPPICLLAISLPMLASAAKDEPFNPSEIAALANFKRPAAPPLSPEDELKTISVSEGFRMELVAAEPLVVAPVTMTFDERGRMWVVEMTGYMPDAFATNEQAPIGAIAILEDTNQDGTFDKRTVFLDKLVLPRAISLVKGGILYAEPPNLWFVPSNNDVPGAKVLIDGAYTGGGNPEHQANGLMRGLDNALYNAGGGKRYVFKDGKWVSELAGTRGQWGICQDDWGRLFYNSNSNQLMCDDAPAGWLMRNSKFTPNRGLGSNVCSSQSLFLTMATPGVNRSHMLDEKGRLKSFTGACGPCIYRGDLFGKEFQGNAFVCEPVANVIRRLVLTESNGKVAGNPVSKEHEFIYSSDERFRPVSLSNGPDGALYVVDFYRGIIQHKAFLTKFLRTQYDERGLAKPLNAGRIWRIVPTQKRPETKPFDLAKKSDTELVATLESANGWWRDSSQRLLVERSAPASVPLLEKLVATSHSPQAIVHAIWTLHGMNSLKVETILPAIKYTQPRVVAQAIRAAASFAGKPESAALLKEIIALANAPDWETKLSVALVAGSFPESEGLETARKLLADNPKDELIRTAVISSLGGRPNEFVALMRENPALASLGKKPTSANPTRKVAGDDKKRWDNGAKIYGNFCVGCHQPGGDGFVGIAPPLAKSEWIQGDPKILGTIILSGIQGPIKVNGKKYESPDIMPLMPGHLPVAELDDAALSDLMTYLRNTFNNNAEPVGTDVAAAARGIAKSHPAPFTPEELHPKK